MHLNCVKRFVTGCQLDSNMFHCIFIQSILLKRTINKSQQYMNLDCDITHWITHTISDFFLISNATIRQKQYFEYFNVGG